MNTPTIDKDESIHDAAKVQEVIIALETEALEAWNRSEPDKFLKLSADNVTYFDPMLDKRMDGLDKLTAYYDQMRGEGRVTKYEMINPVVVSTANMAVLTYNLDSYVGETVYKWNCTEVYKLINSEWKIVHTHWSFIKPNLG